MNAPQLIYLALTCLGLGMALAKHGQPKDDSHSFWWTLTASGICIGLLYWGGFFSGGAA